ncbi:hypothetical protein KEM55_003665 [Ascosphaera atra]|nr:hypothetical protein KEM55_003665 [Ascosphaera atra]
MLWDELYEISAVIENNGELEGEAVPQLYVSLGGPNDPKVVLREFDRIPVQPGVPRTWRTTLTRRDISNWDPVSQNWVITPHEKHIYVGRSSRDLPLEAKLPQPWYMNDA